MIRKIFFFFYLKDWNFYACGSKANKIDIINYFE